MGTPGETWTATVRRLGADAGGHGADLDRRYAQAHRRYHTGTHAAAVVRDAGELAAALDLPDVDRDVITLAACAHDVVYDARPGEDERASAAWARAALTGVDAATVDRVVALVLATIEHRAAPGDRAAQALLDADLAILGTAPAVYAGYVAGVRAEYAAIPEESWRTGRGAVLRGLLARDPIFVTIPARDRWEAAARRNLQDELMRLG